MTDEQRLHLPEEPLPLLIDCAITAVWTTCEECVAKHGGCGSFPKAKEWGNAWREYALRLEKKVEQVRYLVDRSRASTASHHLDDFAYILQQIWAVLGTSVEEKELNLVVPHELPLTETKKAEGGC